MYLSRGNWLKVIDRSRCAPLPPPGARWWWGKPAAALPPVPPQHQQLSVEAVTRGPPDHLFVQAMEATYCIGSDMDVCRMFDQYLYKVPVFLTYSLSACMPSSARCHREGCTGRIRYLYPDKSAKALVTRRF